MAKNSKKAFTIVELMLAVAFLGTLLLSIAILTMQLINIYTKGATMRAINSTGSAIMKDIRSSITSSNNYPAGLDLQSERKNYIWEEDLGDEEATTGYGMFCTGSYSYVWNYQGSMLAYRGEESADRYIAIKDATSERPYALARIKDSGCGLLRGAREASSPKTITINNNDEIVVLIDGKKSGEGTDLALYDFSVITATRSSSLSGKGLYDISFVLGTMRGGVDVSSASNYCKQETGNTSSASAAEYADVSMSQCSVNRFEFVVRQGGMKK